MIAPTTMRHGDAPGRGLRGILLLVLTLPATALGQPGDLLIAEDLFISEYVEGSSLSKAVEIFNATGRAVDLDAEGYVLEIYFNGSTTAGTTIHLTGAMASHHAFVVADDGAAAPVLAAADQVSRANFFNGNDTVVLRKGGRTGPIVDAFGTLGVDPGDAWGSGVLSTRETVLRRKPHVCAGDTDPYDDFEANLSPDTGQWTGLSRDTFDGLGHHSSLCGPGPKDR